MKDDFQVEGSNTKALFTLRVHRGDGMALVAMNWKKGKPPRDCVGFAIEYMEPGGDRFFALKHYSRFLKPGFIRVGIQAPAAELRLSAFLSPDGTQLVVVGLNTSELRTIPVGLGASGFVIQERYRTDFKRQENCKALAADDEKRSLVLPPHALATWVLSKDAP